MRGRRPKPSRTDLYLDAQGKLSSGSRPRRPAFDEYLSDPNKPVPYIGRDRARACSNTYMTEDQRFAADASRRAGVPDRAARSRRDRVRPDRGGPESLHHRHGFGFRREGDRRLSRRLSRITTPRRAGTATAPAPPRRSAHGRLPATGPRRAVPRQVPQELREAGAVRARTSRTASRSPARHRAHVPRRATASWCRSKAPGSR